LGIGLRFRGLALAALLTLGAAHVAQADAYSVTFSGADEAFVVNDTDISGTEFPGVKRAWIMIVAAPGSTRHAFIYARMRTDFDCPLLKFRYLSPMIGKLDAKRYSRDEAPPQWTAAAPDTKIGATLAHVCKTSTHPVLALGTFATPDEAADALLAAYDRFKREWSVDPVGG
jgi:hypothetical protein